MTSAPNLWRRLVAEFLGSALLAAIVIGSGIAAQRFQARAGGRSRHAARGARRHRRAGR